MRYQGKIKSWKDDKGFGFIIPNGGGADVFVHISSFTYKSGRPIVNNLVTYELENNDKGQQQAKNVMFVGEKKSTDTKSQFRVVELFLMLLFISTIGYIGYLRVSQPNSTISATLYKAVFASSALHNQNEFQCIGKKYCSEMSSCSEAFFYQEHCGGTEMDGDNDGIPCEQQWCR